MIAKTTLARLKQAAEEFVELTEHGDFEDDDTVHRYSDLSGLLSVHVLALIVEIERLQREEAPMSPRMLKMDSQRGFA